MNEKRNVFLTYLFVFGIAKIFQNPIKLLDFLLHFKGIFKKMKSILSILLVAFIAISQGTSKTFIIDLVLKFVHLNAIRNGNFKKVTLLFEVSYSAMVLR